MHAMIKINYSGYCSDFRIRILIQVDYWYPIIIWFIANFPFPATPFPYMYQGLVLIIEGEKGQITKFLLQWKTTNIDVDSKGKPCKEKMIQILYREKQKTSGALKDICSCDFQVKECDNLLEYFSGKQLEEIIKSIFV